MIPPDTKQRYNKQVWYGKHHFSHIEGIRQIQILYILAVVTWIILIYALDLHQSSIFGIIILLIPIFVFGISYGSVQNCGQETEEFVLKGNFLSFGFLIVVIIINWNKVGDKSKLFKLLLIALILMMLSLVDVWVRKEKILLTKHFRTVFQTLALTLLVYALYSYYLDQSNSPQEDLKEDPKEDSVAGQLTRVKISHY